MADIRDEEDGTFCAVSCCAPLKELRRPVDVDDLFDSGYYYDSSPGGGSSSSASFFAWPFLGPLLFENQTSDARDHCANERTFLSYLRLSVYMAVVAVAIVLSFHLKTRPSPAELRMAKPLGLVFWGLSVACLLVGLGNYIQTVNKYSRKAAIVQSGIKTQLTMGIVSLSIIATCVTLLVVNKMSQELGSS
ncbi:hypothetical protein INS49_000701 [Diaporthe citri]|uniref:uncharacterized protein n=1 Tax=Diaporthe citri TaxID=83186 RepID=UPI001C7F3FEF|nr:uncharacterized protein INS49_000701 [Diaporthe citri]KAG6366524.1 hypothetical protein INS49_000701 [Diaporthe citri]